MALWRGLASKGASSAYAKRTLAARCSADRPTVRIAARTSPRYAPHPHRPGRPMAEQLLDRILAEIRERREACEAAVREHARLEAALEALGGPIEGEPKVRHRSRGVETSAP